jgi:hypothetical protein
MDGCRRLIVLFDGLVACAALVAGFGSSKRRTSKAPAVPSTGTSTKPSTPTSTNGPRLCFGEVYCGGGNGLCCTMTADARCRRSQALRRPRRVMTGG